MDRFADVSAHWPRHGSTAPSGRAYRYRRNTPSMGPAVKTGIG